MIDCIVSPFAGVSLYRPADRMSRFPGAAFDQLAAQYFLSDWRPIEARMLFIPL